MRVGRGLPNLKNDNNLQRIVNNLDKIIDVTSTENMDLITINHVKCTTTLLITDKIMPPKPKYNQKPGTTIMATRTQETKRPNKRRHNPSPLNTQMETLRTRSRGNSGLSWRHTDSMQGRRKADITSQTQWLTCYTKRSEQYKQNKMFREDYQMDSTGNLERIPFQIENLPDIWEVKTFWQNIWEQEVKHNEDGQWITDQQEELQQINQME